MRHMALGVPSDTMECTATQMYTAAKTPLVAHRYMMSLREKKGICAVQQYGSRRGTKARMGQLLCLQRFLHTQRLQAAAAATVNCSQHGTFLRK